MDDKTIFTWTTSIHSSYRLTTTTTTNVTDIKRHNISWFSTHTWWPRLKACTRGVVLNNHSSYSIHWLQSCKWERRGESGTKDSGRTKLQSTARRLTVWYVRICGTWDSENPGFWIPCGICKISYVEELIPVVLCSRKFKRAILNFQKSLCISFVQFPFYRESYLFFFISVIKGIFRKKIKGK